MENHPAIHHAKEHISHISFLETRLAVSSNTFDLSPFHFHLKVAHHPEGYILLFLNFKRNDFFEGQGIRGRERDRQDVISDLLIHSWPKSGAQNSSHSPQVKDPKSLSHHCRLLGAQCWEASPRSRARAGSQALRYGLQASQATF